MIGAPLPDFTAIVRATPYEQLPALNAALGEAAARTIARIAEEASSRSRRGTQEATPTKWGTTIAAARVAGLIVEGEGDKTKLRQARQQVAAWARKQPWASRLSRRRIQIDLDAFRRWLDVKRSA